MGHRAYLFGWRQGSCVRAPEGVEGMILGIGRAPPLLARRAKPSAIGQLADLSHEALRVDTKVAVVFGDGAGPAEVFDCWLMTGNRDHLLRDTTSGRADFERFLTGRFTKIPSVASIERSNPRRRVNAGLARTMVG